MTKRKNESDDEFRIRKREYQRLYYKQHPGLASIYQKKYRDNLKQMGVYDLFLFEANEKREKRESEDCVYASHRRDTVRKSRAIKRRKIYGVKKPYKPRPQMRYPSYVCRNGIDLKRATLLENAYSKVHLMANLTVAYNNKEGRKLS